MKTTKAYRLEFLNTRKHWVVSSTYDSIDKAKEIAEMIQSSRKNKVNFKIIEVITTENLIKEF